MDLLLPDEEIRKYYLGSRLSAVKDALKAQLARVFNNLKEALEQSRKGEEVDLPPDWFELFSAIQNEGVRKYHEHPDYDPRAVQVGWYIEHGWLPPDEAERLKEEIREDYESQGIYLGTAILEEAKKQEREKIKVCILQSIADEREKVFSKIEKLFLKKETWENNYKINESTWQALKEGK